MEDLFWRMIKTGITAAVRPPSPMLLNVKSGFVGRRGENDGTKRVARRKRSGGY